MATTAYHALSASHCFPLIHPPRWCVAVTWILLAYVLALVPLPALPSAPSAYVKSTFGEHADHKIRETGYHRVLIENEKLKVEQKNFNLADMLNKRREREDQALAALRAHYHRGVPLPKDVFEGERMPTPSIHAEQARVVQMNESHHSAESGRKPKSGVNTESDSVPRPRKSKMRRRESEDHRRRDGHRHRHKKRHQHRQKHRHKKTHRRG